jgi:signal transduction histidine kinase
LNLDWRKSKVLTRLSGPRLFDRRFFWWTYFAAFVVQITFDVIAYDSPSWLWLVVWTAGHLLATLAAVIIRVSFLDKYLEKKPNPYLNIFVASILGAIRVTFIGYSSFVLELQDLFDLGARIIAGMISGFVAFIVFVNYTESSRSFRELSQKLQRTQSQLKNLRKDTLEAVRNSQLEAQNKVETLIEPKLEKLSALIASQSKQSTLNSQITSEIQELLKGEVKALNESFRRPTKTLLSSAAMRPVSRLNLFRLPGMVQPHLAIRPALVTMAGLAGVPFSLYVFSGASWIPTGLLLVFLDFLLLSFGKLFLSTLKPMPVPVAIISLVALTLATCAVDAPVLLWAGFPANEIAYPVIIGAITNIASMIVFGLVVVHDYNRERYLEKLKKNNKKIERELALVNQQIWVSRRAWALRIHGTVQASLTAALARVSSSNKLSEAELRQVAAHISQARKGLVGVEDEFDFAKSVRNIKKTWKGIIEIKIDLNSPGAKLLIADKWAGVIANEIIKESVSNSMKHGKATKVNISFETKEPGFVQIVAEDNGRALANQFRPGLGSEILDEIAYPWSLNKFSGGVRLDARIPVSRKTNVS